MALSLGMDASAPFDPAKSSMAQTCFSEEGLGGFAQSPPRIPLKSAQIISESLLSFQSCKEAVNIAIQECLERLAELGALMIAIKKWRAAILGGVGTRRGFKENCSVGESGKGIDEPKLLDLPKLVQYLMALVDKGGTKTHSSGSRGFRSRYTSTVLFLGAYVWINFREVAPPSQQKPSRGLRRKCKVDEFGQKVCYGNYEPRFKPTRSDKPIYVALYEEEEHARIIYQILAFYYGRAVPGELPLLNGSSYRIPCMTEEEQRLDPESKKEWAKAKAKVVLDEFKRAWSNSVLLASLPDPQEVEAAGDIPNIHPPDAGVRCDGQFGNYTDGSDVPVPPRSRSPDLGPETQVHVADDSFNDHVATAGAGVSDDPPTEPALEEWLATFIQDPEEVQATGDISNIFPPDAQADFQLGNRSGGLDVAVPPSNFVPNVGPAIPIPAADDSCNDHAPAVAGVSDEPFLEPHVQHHAQTNNVNPVDPTATRLLKEVLRQQQLQQFQIQQLVSEKQQLGIQYSVLQRHQQLQDFQMQQQVFQMQQQQSRISELEGEVELLRSTEPARKRICVGLSLTHNTQS